MGDNPSMVRFEFRWWVWLFVTLLIYMIFRGPGAMAWVVGGILHGFADVGNDLIKGLGGMQRCGSPCHTG